MSEQVNKADRIDPAHRTALDRNPDSVTTCALLKEGVGDLMAAIEAQVGRTPISMEPPETDAG